MALDTALSYHLVTEQLDRKLATELQSSARHGGVALQRWAAAHTLAARAWAASPELLAVFDVLAALPDRDALVASPAQRRLRATLAPVLGHDAYDGYFLLDRQGRALASSRDENVFEDHSLAGAWVGTGRTLAGESILSLPLPSRMQLDNAEGIPTAGRPTQFVGAPLKDPSGRVVGGFTWRLRPTDDLFPMVQGLRPLPDGDAFLVDGAGAALTPLHTGQSRGLESLGVGVDEPAVATLLATHSSGVRVTPLPGQGGIPTVAAWMWMPELEMGLVVRRPAREARSLHRSVFRILALFGLLSTGSSAMLTWLAARFVLRGERAEQDRQTQMAERARLLEAANAELRNANDDLEAFSRAASHDLKAPLRDLITLSGWLVEDLGPDLGGEDRENLDLIRERASHMERLLRDLHEHAESARDEAPTESMTVRALLDAALNLAGRRAGIDVVVGSTPAGPLPLPRVPLEAIVRNLVSNALVHHDRTHGLVTVRASIDDNVLLIKVVDDGPGIETEDQLRIFQPFQRLKARKQDGAPVSVWRWSADKRSQSVAQSGFSQPAGVARFGCGYRLRLPASSKQRSNTQPQPGAESTCQCH